MGFYVTGSECERREKTHPPSKNRVWDFFATFHTCAGQNIASAQYPRPENEPTPTATASGARYYGYRFYSPGLGRWISRDTIEEQGGLNLYGFVDNDPVNWFDTLGDSKSNGGDDSSTWKDFWKAAVEIHKNYEKYKKLTDQAKQTFRTQINPNYDCCWKCKSGYKVSDWDDPDNPNIGYQVLHRQIGCELQKAGASQEAMALLNVLYETKTSIYEMFAKLEVSKKSGVDDWIWDTAKDMAAVMEGWQQGGGDCATKFIPSECTKKDGK